MPFELDRVHDRRVHEEGPAGGDDRLHQRLHGASEGRVDPGDARGAQARAGAHPARRQPDRQQPREAHQRRGLRQARARQGWRGPAQGGGRPVGEGRRGRPPHHRRRRHQHHRGGPGGVSREERLSADRGGPAQDRRQRRLPDQAVARRVDCRGGGGEVLPQRGQGEQRQPARAYDPRGDGAQLRLAHLQDGAVLPQDAQGNGAQGPVPRRVRPASPSARSTSRPRRPASPR